MKLIKLLLAMLMLCACTIEVPQEPIETPTEPTIEEPQEKVITFDNIKEEIKVSITEPRLVELAPMYEVCANVVSVELPSNVSKVEFNIYYYDEDNAPLLDEFEKFQFVDLIVEDNGDYEVVGFYNASAVSSEIEIVYVELVDGTILN